MKTKRFLAALLALNIAYGITETPFLDLTDFSVKAENTVAVSDTLDSGMTWSIDEEGTFTITGTGEIDANHHYTIGHGWYDYKERIKKVVIGNGITTIPEFAFAGCENLVAVELPDTIEELGRCSFTGCAKLDKINFPDLRINKELILLFSGNIEEKYLNSKLIDFLLFILNNLVLFWYSSIIGKILLNNSDSFFLFIYSLITLYNSIKLYLGFKIKSFVNFIIFILYLTFWKIVNNES